MSSSLVSFILAAINCKKLFFRDMFDGTHCWFFSYSPSWYFLALVIPVKCHWPTFMVIYFVPTQLNVTKLTQFWGQFGLAAGKHFIKTIFDIKIQIVIFEMSNMPNFNKFWALLILQPIWAKQVVIIHENNFWHQNWDRDIRNIKCAKFQ